MNTTLAHKIALDPTPEQQDFFQRAAGTARFTWNWALTEWQERYQKGEKPNGHLLKKSFNALRRVQFPWTYDVHRDATARPFADLQTAFINFWKDRAAYPNQLGQAMPKVTPVERLSAGLSFGSGETQLVEAGTGRVHICTRER